MVKSAGLAFIVALTTAMITSFVMTKETEAVPFGALVNPYVLPAILAFYAIDVGSVMAYLSQKCTKFT